MAIWRITCPDCRYREQVKIDIDDFPENEKNEFLNKIRPNEIIIKIPTDEIDKLCYALNHVQLTGDEHIDDFLNNFNSLLKEKIEEHKKIHVRRI